MSQEIELTTAQQAAVDSLTQHCIVSAGAGSGKTRVLVERFLKILAEHQYNPDLLDQVVAITFTEKAATEMKERIRQSIRQRYQWAKKEGRLEEADGWYRMSIELERARITTIHSFCHLILQRYPIEAGVDPEFIVLEEFEARWLLKQAVEEILTQFFQSPQANEPSGKLLEQWLVGVGVQSAHSQLIQTVTQCSTYGWTAKQLKQITIQSLNRAELSVKKHHISELEQQLLKAADFLLAVKKIKAAEQFRLYWSDLKERWDQMEEEKDRYQLLVALQDTLKGNWGRNEEVKRALTNCLEACAGLIHLTKNNLFFPNEICLSTLFCDLIADIQAHYQASKTERTGVDFDEMQWRVCQLLQHYPEIRREIRERIRYLMVDEYQDTNDLQKKLVDLIIQDEHGHSTPGQLFVVGDPKQSIYRFRGADVSLFQLTKTEILAANGKQVELSANFRSHPELISFFNHFFGQLMSNDSESPNYYNQVESREDSTKPEVVVEYLYVPDKKEREEEEKQQEIEAKMIAAHIAKRIEKGDRYQDMAILFRAMTHVKIYERELARLKIPFHVVKGRGFYDRQEVLDLFYFLRILIEPANRLALIGVLRSPFCGISDETLLQISLDNQWQTPLSEWSRLTGLTQAEQKKLEQFAELYHRAETWLGAISVSDLMERLLTESGYRHVMWATPEGKQAAANLKKLIHQARSLTGLEAFSIPVYLERVELFITEAQVETEASVESEHSNSVKLMTIHQAKGLEFPIVFVPDLSKKEPGFKDLIQVDPVLGLVAVLRDEKGEKIELERWLQFKARYHQLEWEESVRLFYVATTRAENTLILSGMAEQLKEEKALQETIRWSHWLDRILHYDTIDWKEQKWLFSEHCLPIRVYRESEDRLEEWSYNQIPLDEIFSDQGVHPQSQLKEKDTILLQPRGFTEQDLLEISVTKWKGLINCPRNYFYQHVLGLPSLEFANEANPHIEAQKKVLTPTQKGEIVHRLIELLSAPEHKPPEVDRLYEQVFDEFTISAQDRFRAKQESISLVKNFLNHRIYQEQSKTEPLRTEQRFIVDMAGVEVYGVIDYLHLLPDGTWEVIDYKTDFLTIDEVIEAAEDYLPQLQLYVLAAKKKWGILPKRATLFFLTPDQEVSFPVTDQWLQKAENRLKESAEWLRQHNPSRPWITNTGKRCKYCDYRMICEAALIPESR